MTWMNWWHSIKDGQDEVEAVKEKNLQTAETHEHAMQRVTDEREQAVSEHDELREVVREVVRRLNKATR